MSDQLCSISGSKCHALVIWRVTRDQQAKIADTQTLRKYAEWHIFIFLIFDQRTCELTKSYSFSIDEGPGLQIESIVIKIYAVFPQNKTAW